MDEPDVVAYLRSIDRRLALLTGKEERELRNALIAGILSTAARISMWDAIDGRAGSPELAKKANVSDRAAQLFVRELLDAGLVKAVPASRGTVVAKDENAIVQWYLEQTPVQLGAPSPRSTTRGA